VTGAPRPAARVLTLTLNPALDLTVRADHLTLDTVNAGQGLRTDAGGKGVNVARVLADHGVNVTATGLLGQDNAEAFEALFEQRGIEDAFLWVPGSTRVGVKLVDHAAQQTTDINLPGLQATPDTLGELHARLRDLQATHDVLVLSGSVPPGVPTTVYADLTREWRAAGKTVVLDTSGEPLRHALHAGASIVKPNIHELEGALGHPLGSETDVLHAAHALLASGTDLVVVSQGERGALFVTRDAALLATPPRVSVQSTVGAATPWSRASSPRTSAA